MARERKGLNVLEHPLIAPFVVITVILFLIWIVAEIFQNVQLPANSTLATAYHTVSGAFGTVATMIIVALVAGVGIYILIMLVRSLRG